ncbi:MAG: carboxypeptidase-like regulatory domain-containing protein, partial [Prevotellaceae bacterium]|nr:carboxypeptidase-like regulatory domain-containing protein [Prevotellaceae bacterium]
MVLLPCNRLSRLSKRASVAGMFLLACSPYALAAEPVNSVQKTHISLPQQKKTVKGKIVDGNGEPMIGVTIAEKGTKNRAITDTDGNYTIQVEGSSPVLVVSYVGFTEQAITVGNRASINVTMKEDNQTLNEVVVQGFGIQQKKESLTGAISSINARDV